MSEQDRRKKRRALGLLMGLLALAVAYLALVRPFGLGDGSTPGSAGGSDLPPDEAALAIGILEIEVVGPEGEALVGAHLDLSDESRAREGRTDAEGSLRLDSLVPGVYTLRVESPGLARQALSVLISPDPQSVRVQLEPGGIITGRILSERGEAMEGGQIVITPDTLPDETPFDGAFAEQRWEGLSDEEGRFGFDTLAAGFYTIALSAPGHTSVTRRVEVVPGAPAEIQVALHLSATIRGTVRGPDGLPVEGADVQLAGSGVWPARVQLSEPDGSFLWEGIPGGVYEVRARQGALVAHPREGLVIDSGRTISIDLRLGEGIALRGKVLDDVTGEPISGAELVLTDDPVGLWPRGTSSDAEGGFVFDGLLPREHHLSARASGYVAIATLACEPGGDPLEIRLQPEAILVGRVFDERDRPVAGAHIDVLGDPALSVSAGLSPFGGALFAAQAAPPLGILPSGDLGITLGSVPLIPLVPVGEAGGPVAPLFVAEFVTDPEGRFRVTGLPVGTAQLLVQHVDFAPVATDPVHLEAGETGEELVIVLPDGGSVSGRVVDPRGFPVPDVLVEMAAEREPIPRTVMAGSDGSFEFTAALGAVTLTALPSGQPAARERIEVASGQALEVDLVLETELKTLDGRAVDRRGFPVAGARVALRSLNPRSPSRRAAISADDGTFSITGLPSPPYRLVVEHPDYVPTRVARITSVEEELPIVLMPGGTLFGAVIDDFTGEPLAGARVELRRDGATAASTSTDAEGQFELRDVPIGNYKTFVSATGCIDAEREVVLGIPRSGPIELGLVDFRLDPAGGVSGEVVDALGYAVPGAKVAWGEEPDWRAAVRTDAEGHFELSGLPPGDHLLHARADGLGEATTPSAVRVHRTETTADVRIRMSERLSLDPDRTPDAAYQNGVAILVGRRGDDAIITEVVSGSKADEAGLRRGDILISVDGHLVAVPSQARSMLRGATGVEAILEIGRSGRTRRIIVARERYRPPESP